MIYTPLTIKAMKIAYTAHHGQLDKCGTPYIFHPIHLAESMDDEISCCAALLHDTVEDTDLTFDDLAKEFPAEIIEVLRLLTHDDDTPYFEYVKKIATNSVAKKVKLADLAHNSDQSRCADSNVSPEKLAIWREKYEKATKILTED